ncbi:MAG: hypothetical protein NPMRIOTA_120017 [Nitrosopumilales archaeon]|nr:MAG: hypothetical protein NPMRIOTA_120017 [Nitrosopumilales archaeon]
MREKSYDHDDLDQYLRCIISQPYYLRATYKIIYLLFEKVGVISYWKGSIKGQLTI